MSRQPGAGADGLTRRLGALTIGAALLVTSGCDMREHPQPAQQGLADVSSSGLVVVPKERAPGYFFSGATVNTGVAATPLTGSAAAQGKRLFGGFATDASGGGSMSWCVARPADFSSLCAVDSTPKPTIYVTADVDGLRVVAYGTGYPTPPTSASDFTTDLSQASWVEEGG